MKITNVLFGLLALLIVAGCNKAEETTPPATDASATAPAPTDAAAGGETSTARQGGLPAPTPGPGAAQADSGFGSKAGGN